MAKINKEEYELLISIVFYWKWLARDRDGRLYKFHGKPEKVDSFRWNDRKQTWLGMSSDRFQFIQWENEEPHNIAELIEEYEYSALERHVNSFKELSKVKSKQELIEEWESAIEAAEFYGKGKEERLISYMKDFVSDLNQLDEPETLTPEWIDERIHYSTDQDAFGNIVRIEMVPAKYLQNLLAPKQELPVIPQFVADWLEEYKEDELIITAGTVIGNRRFPKDTKVAKWLNEDYVRNSEVFAQAWLAYPNIEVEEEQKYIVKLPMSKNNDNQYATVDYSGNIWIDALPSKYKLTEEEIRGLTKGDILFEHFAVKVEEMEE